MTGIWIALASGSGVANLHRHLLGGAVQHGLAMKADDIDVFAGNAVLGLEAGDGFGMRHGHDPLGLRRMPGRASRACKVDGLRQSLEQQTALEIGIRSVAGRAERLDAFAVGFDHGDVNPVQRGPAHQAYGR